MCLEVKKIYHRDGAPLVAEEDIIVYKVLYVSNDRERYYTPYRAMRIDFRRNRASLPRIHRMITEEGYINSKKLFVGRGYHSYLVEPLARIRCFQNRQLFKAIIPKGASYYIGNMRDIVSDRLIIFKPSIFIRND